MKTTAVLRAAAFWSLRPRLLDRLSPFVLVDGVRQKYQFKQYPSTEQLSAQTIQPVQFVYGKTEVNGHEIIIEQLLITYVGTQATSVAASTRTSTDDTDLFLKHLSDWVSGEYDVDVSAIYPPVYTSALEVKFNKSLSSGFKRIEAFGQQIGEKIRSYGSDSCPDFEFSGFSFGYDNTKPLSGPVMWVPFSIERRLGVSYGENAYFSQAPLRTRDHERILRHLERLF